VADSCAICGQKIVGNHVRTSLGELVCEADLPVDHCRWCARVHRRPDHRCELCASSATHNSREAVSLSRAVLQWLEGHIPGHNMGDIPVEVVAGDFFGSSSNGMTRWRSAGNRLVDMVVQVRSGLPAFEIQSVLAHEYGHVMLVRHPTTGAFTGGLGGTRDDEEEGFCEVLRVLWIDHARGPSWEYRVKSVRDNPDPVYGGGFRRVWPAYVEAGSVTRFRETLFGQVAPGVIDGNSGTERDGHVPDEIVIGGSHRPTLAISPSQRVPPVARNAPPQDSPRRPDISWRQ